jgi:choline dehydrogenase-like flavoprotein
MSDEWLTPYERAILVRVAEVSMPAGHGIPGGGAPAVARTERFFGRRPALAQHGYRSLAWALESVALARHGTRFSRLSDARALALLERWRGAGYYPRLALRGLTAPLKMAHFDDPEIFKQLGCRYAAEPVKPEPKPRWFERVTSGAEVTGAEAVEADVVVIGTGAGGAVAARELAEAGLAVVMLEEGRYFTRADFTGRPIEMQFKMYRDGAATFTAGNVGIPVPLGLAVGGTTTVNSGTCYRAPEWVLRRWRHDYGLLDFSPESLAPFYERVERAMEVAPGDPKHLGGSARVVARGAEKLGYRHRALLRNAPECDGQGVCCFGCPTDAKKSMNVSYVPLALRAGANLFTECRVDRILTEGGRAVGVEASLAGGGTLRVRARAVVVACGTLLTPVLLAKSGLCGTSGQLGRNLSIHPAVGVYATFDESLKGYDAIPQGYAVEQFHEEGILLEGAFTPLDYGAGAIMLLGHRYMEVMAAYERLACFGMMIEDTSRGRVWPVPGTSRPFVSYMLNDRDVARIKRGTEILCRIFLAAGARVVLPNVFGHDEITGEADLRRFRAATFAANDFEILAYHPLGTARLGVDPRTSVVGQDHQAHDVPGLYVMDGAAVPSSLAVNPMLTIMALATRAAQKLAGTLSG